MCNLFHLFVAFWQGCSSVKMKRISEIDWKLVQRINIWFAVKVGLSCPEITQQIQAVHSVNSLSSCRIRHWFREFQNGCTTLVDLQRAPRDKSRCSPANIQTIRTLVQADKNITLDGLHAASGLPRTTIHWILKKDLKLTKRSAHLVPKDLNPRQLCEHLECSQRMLRAVQRSPELLKRIITMDESWVYTYDLTSKIQSCQWLAVGEPRPVKEQWSRANGKSLLVSFFDNKGLLYFEFVRGTLNARIFVQILGRLKIAMTNRRRRNVQYYLHMDNASPHTALPTRLQLVHTGLRTVVHPPYSPDLAQSDFWFFGRLKKGIKGRRFQNLDDLEEAVRQEISSIPSTDYADCILNKWPMHWAHCMFHNGDYFEGLS